MILEPTTPAPTPTWWTIDRVETLKTLWAAGDLSASRIAAEMKTTRNAVLGKVHRLGLASRSPAVSERKLTKDARRLGLEPRKPREKIQREPRSIWLADKFGVHDMIKPANEFKAPVVRPGQSKTSPTYRNQLGFLPEMTVNQRRNMLAEAMRNTAALPIDEAL